MSVAGLEMQWLVGGAEDPEALRKLMVAFERSGEELRDFGKYLWPKLTPVLEAAEKAQFDAEGEGESGSWAPLSAQYAAWKEANYPGSPILHRTGALFEALTDSSSPLALRQADGDSYNFGTQGVTYASYLQSGTKNMPARRVIDFGVGFETELSRIGVDAARESMQQAGLDNFADLSHLHGT